MYMHNLLAWRTGVNLLQGIGTMLCCITTPNCTPLVSHCIRVVIAAARHPCAGRALKRHAMTNVLHARTRC